MPHSTNSISIVCDEPALVAAMPLPSREAGRILLRMLEECRRLREDTLVPHAPGSIVLALLGDGEMASLNKASLGLKGPTNILSFPEEEEAELALCVPQLLREALLYGQKADVHLVRLLAHGMAHVCGLDHGDEMDRAQGALEQAGLELL